MNSKIRKGIAINSLFLLAGGLMFAGLVFTLYTQSPLAEVLFQGSDMVQKNVDYTIDISSDDELSDLAMFTYQRASRLGCSENSERILAFDEGGTVYGQNNNNDDNDFIDKWAWGNPNQQGYPGLQDSYLGRYPECYGAGDSALRGADGANPAESGNDMEGIYSREQFEIKEVVVLEAGDESTGKVTSGNNVGQDNDEGDTWLEKNFMVASKDSFEQKAKGCSEYYGTRQQFALYFQPEPSDNRALPWMSNENEGIGDNGPYCENTGTPGPYVSPFMAGIGTRDDPSKVVLCPGDKGYVQMNKWTAGQDPTHDGEAGVGGDNAFKAGFIQITELGEDCGTAVPQIPPDENSIGNVFELDVDIRDGWETLREAKLHQVEDSRDFYNAQPVSPSDNQCVLLLREDDTLSSERGKIVYKAGTKLSQSPDYSQGFPDLGYEQISDFEFDSETRRSGKPIDHGVATIYTGEINGWWSDSGPNRDLESWDGLETEGFTGEQVNNDFPFLKNTNDGTSTFEPYGDMLCTKADTDEDKDSSSARWVVCDESNYNSPTTVNGAHYDDDRDDREYRCNPGSGDWEVVN